MPTVSQGASATVDIAIGSKLSVSTAGEAYVDIVSGPTGAGYTSKRISNGTQTFGPYGVVARVQVRAVSGTATYDSAGDLFPAQVAVDASGNVLGLQGPGGKIIPTDPNYLAAATKSPAYVGGATPWTRLFGPNELNAMTRSGELTNTAKYVSAATPANGPAMFRREGGAIYIDGALATANYGNLRTTSAGIAAGAWANTTIAIPVYWHRLNSNSSVILRVGKDTGNYVTYKFDASANLLSEGFNVLLASTAEPIGAGNSPLGQYAFNSAFSVLNGWLVGAGTFSFATDTIGYVALEVNGIQAASQIHNSHVWFEGVYVGGKDKSRLTLGFDIQTNGLDLAKSTMDKYGLLGYAAIPTANANPSAPAFLLAAADVTRLQALYNAGWDIIQHSVSHNSMGNYSDDGMIQAEIEGCRAQIIQMGCPRGADLLALPNNSTSSRVVSIAAKAGVKWVRGTGPLLRSSGLVGDANPLLHGSMTIANQSTSERAIAFIDLLIQYGASGHMYTHAIQNAASDSLNTNVTVFDEICAYIAAKVAAGQLEVVTPSQFVARQTWPNIENVIGLPSRLSITPGASPFNYINSGYKPYVVTISGGTVSDISYSKDGSTYDATSQVAGQFIVSPGDRLRITYSVAPTIIQQRVTL